MKSNKNKLNKNKKIGKKTKQIVPNKTDIKTDIMTKITKNELITKFKEGRSRSYIMEKYDLTRGAISQRVSEDATVKAAEDDYYIDQEQNFKDQAMKNMRDRLRRGCWKATQRVLDSKPDLGYAKTIEFDGSIVDVFKELADKLPG